MRLTLRTATPDDVATILEAVLEGVRRSVYRDDACDWPGKVKAWARDHRVSNNPEHRLYIATLGTNSVGYVAIRPAGAALAGRVPPGATELMAGGIFASHEGRGLGRELVCAAVAEIRSEDPSRVIVGRCEREAKAMRHILHSLGFHEALPRPDVVSDRFDAAFVLTGEPACEEA